MKAKTRNKDDSREPALTAGEIARHCHVTVATIRRWVSRGLLGGFATPGRHRRVPLSELQRFLKEHGMPSYPVERHETPVLVVDDEEEMVTMLVDFLTEEPRPFKVETATDGYEALIKIGSFKPALLILDVVMPRLDGVEVCRRLKASPATRAIKILGLTGAIATIPKLLDAGADACLAKPVSLEAIRQEIDRLVAS